MAVLRNVTKEDTVQYVLALLEDFFAQDAAHAALLYQPSQQHPGTVTQPTIIFSRLLNRPDWFTQEKACRLLTLALDNEDAVCFLSCALCLLSLSSCLLSLSSKLVFLSSELVF